MSHLFRVRSSLAALCGVVLAVAATAILADGSLVPAALAQMSGATGVVPSGDNGLIVTGINYVLSALTSVAGIIGIAGSVIFVYIINPDVVTAILASPIIAVTWTIVRDILNLVFIIVLLFSAFATIFHVESYHLRGVLPRLVIMALLVNFSLPVAQVIIDIANIIMYFFINNLFPQTAAQSGFQIPALFGKYTNVGNMLSLTAGKDPMVLHIFNLVFTFMFGVTIFVIAGILAVRLVILAFLLIMSPVGFVGFVVPGAANFADTWWRSLLRQAFTGPVLVFTLYFAISFASNVHSIAFVR